jgi:hypothetical protein
MVGFRVLRDMEIVDIPFSVGTLWGLKANCVRPVGIADNNGLYF